MEPITLCFTASVIQGVKDGKLQTDFVHTRGAYDSVAKKIGLDIVETFPNGTEETDKFIGDYEEVGYYHRAKIPS